MAFLKRKQSIRDKEFEAKKIQDEKLKTLALENVKLLNDQLLSDEKALVKSREELEIKKEQKAIEIAKKEEERALSKQTRADEKERRDIERALAEITREDKQQIAADEKEQKAVQRSTLEDERTTTRIEKLKEEAEILKAHQAGLEQEEIDFLSRRQELRTQEQAAKVISDETERDLTLENIQLKHEQLLLEESEFFLQRDELRAEQLELEQALQAELDQLSTDQREALQAEELKTLKASLISQKKLRSKDAQQEIINRRKENKIVEEDTKKHGAVIAEFKKFQRSEELGNASTAAGELSRLQESENDKMRQIGKAAALVQIAIDTQRGAIAAYTALAGIPIVGPGLGIAAAAALTAFGFERASKVQAAQAGGIVAGSGFGDRIPFLLEPGELITPRQNFEEVINAVSAQRDTQRDTPDDVEPTENITEIMIGFNGEEAADILTVEQNEQSFLRTSQQL